MSFKLTYWLYSIYFGEGYRIRSDHPFYYDEENGLLRRQPDGVDLDTNGILIDPKFEDFKDLEEISQKAVKTFFTTPELAFEFMYRLHKLKVEEDYQKGLAKLSKLWMMGSDGQSFNSRTLNLP